MSIPVRIKLLLEDLTVVRTSLGTISYGQSVEDARVRREYMLRIQDESYSSWILVEFENTGRVFTREEIFQEKQ